MKFLFQLNPLHKVPVLQHNELILTDSHAILIYLAGSYNETHSDLYPSDEQIQIKILNRLLYNCSEFFQRDSALLNDIVLRQATDLTEHMKEIHQCYTHLEMYLAEGKFIAGEKMTIADLSIVATLSTTDLIIPVNRDRWPKVSTWYNQMKKLPYYQGANQEGVENLKSKINQFTKIKIL